MMHDRIDPLWMWAARDVIRYPYEALLAGAALTLFVGVVASVLFLTQAYTYTTDRVLKDAPSLVVRKIDAGGWAPIPIEECLQSVHSIPGVVKAQVRVWGAAAGPDGTVTVIGVDDAVRKKFLGLNLPIPSKGQAVLGPGVKCETICENIMLAGRRVMPFQVVGRLGREMSPVAHDIVLTDRKDAQRLLGLRPGFASDLAIWVFHEEEEQAMLSDLSRAFPWTVRIVTKKESSAIHTAGASRRGGIAMIMLIPAMLALLFLVTGVVRDRMGKRHETGLLQAMGWTSGNIVTLQIFRSILICLPAAALGLTLAYALVFGIGADWPGRLLLGWREISPDLDLNLSGRLLVAIEVFGLAVLPFLSAALWPALKTASADPQDLITGSGD